MNLLKQYEDKEAYNMVSIIYEINQIMKNCKSDKCYTIKNGTCYAYKSAPEDIIHQTLKFNTLSNRNKKVYNDDLELINGYLNGKEFFDWYGKCKKFITKLELYDDCFIIYTQAKNEIFKSKSINIKEVLNIDYNAFKSFLKRVKEKEYKLYIEENNFEGKLEELNLKDLIIPYELKFKDVKFRVTNKVFQNLKKESIVSFKIYTLDEKNDLYLVKFLIENKNSILTNYCTIINY